MVPSTNTTEIRKGTNRGPSTDTVGASVTSTGRSPPAAPEGGNAHPPPPPRTATECHPQTQSHQAPCSCQPVAASLDPHMDTPVVKCPQHWSPRPTHRPPPHRPDKSDPDGPPGQHGSPRRGTDPPRPVLEFPEGHYSNASAAHS